MALLRVLVLAARLREPVPVARRLEPVLVARLREPPPRKVPRSLKRRPGPLQPMQALLQWIWMASRPLLASDRPSCRRREKASLPLLNALAWRQLVQTRCQRSWAVSPS